MLAGYAELRRPRTNPFKLVVDVAPLVAISIIARSKSMFHTYSHVFIESRQFPSCRECQVKDWKEGIPRPHKEICGKTSLSDAC